MLLIRLGPKRLQTWGARNDYIFSLEGETSKIFKKVDGRTGRPTTILNTLTRAGACSQKLLGGT